MNNTINIVILPVVFSFLISYLITPIVIKYAMVLKIIDDPKKTKHPKVIHTQPVPRGGGIPIFISTFVVSLIFVHFDIHLIGIFLGAFILTLIGILDDRYNINPYVRLAIQFLAASIPILASIGIEFINSPFGGIINLNNSGLLSVSNIFSIFWIVFLMNILNMGAKGVDGQLPGVAAIAAATIAFLSLNFSADITEWPVITLAVIIAGSHAGFTPWNFYPQKIMPGFSGGTLAGYFLAILSILSTTKVGTLLVCLGIPIIDTSYTITRRVLSGKSPVWGDAGHLHHRLLQAGLTKKQVTITYWAGTALLGIIALNLNAQNKLYTIIGVFLVIGGLLIWLTRKPNKAK